MDVIENTYDGIIHAIVENNKIIYHSLQLYLMRYGKIDDDKNKSNLIKYKIDFEDFNHLNIDHQTYTGIAMDDNGRVYLNMIASISNNKHTTHRNIENIMQRLEMYDIYRILRRMYGCEYIDDLNYLIDIKTTY